MGRKARRTGAARLAWGCMAGAMTLAGCALRPPGPAAVAEDRRGEVPAAPSAAAAVPSFEGFYAGQWTPAAAGRCAGAQPVARTMLVEATGAASGVNFPLRGFVQPDGTASLAYGKAAVVGRFDAAGGFTGQASTGPGCLWDVAMTLQPPIASAVPPAGLPASDVVQGEVPQAPAEAVRTLLPSLAPGGGPDAPGRR